ncbi:MAG: glycosyltransferase family 39 protein [Thermoanaerobaculia bacterium]
MPVKRVPATLLLVSLAARLAAAASRGWGSVRFGDSRAYIVAARKLVQSGTYPANTDGFFFRAPGYPFFLAATTFGHPDWIFLDKLWNAALGAGAVLLLWAIARRVFGSEGLALAVGAVAAVHPAFLFFGSQVQSEPLYVLLALFSGFFLLVCVDRPSSGMGLLAGGALALAALVRPSALALAPFLAAPLLDRRYPARVRRALAGSAVLGFCAALSPWMLRNAIAFKTVLPVNDEAGFTFYQGNSDWNLRFYRLESREEYRRFDLSAASKWRSAIPGLDDPNPSRRSFALVRAALRWARAHPREEVWVLWKKVEDWLRPGASPLVRKPSVVLATSVYYGAGFLLCAIGLASARRKGTALFCVSILGVTMAIHVAFLVLLRYRMASWDPILVLYSPAGALVLFSRFRR